MFRKILLFFAIVFSMFCILPSKVFAEEEIESIVVGSFVKNRDFTFVIDKENTGSIPCRINQMRHAITGGVLKEINKIFEKSILFDKYGDLYKITVEKIEVKDKEVASDIFNDFVVFLTMEEKKGEPKKSQFALQLTGGIFCANFKGKFNLRLNFLQEEIRDFFDLSISYLKKE